MRGAVIYGPKDVRLQERPDPTIVSSRRTRSCAPSRPACADRTCGATAASSRSPSRRRSGTSTSASSKPSAPTCTSVKPGQFVVGGFLHQRQHLPGVPGRACSRTACTAPATTAARPSSSGSRTPTARSLATPEQPGDDLVPSLLALSDVMCTGWHAAVCADVRARRHRGGRRRRRGRPLRRAGRQRSSARSGSSR